MIARSYELCRNNYDPTYGGNCSCGILDVTTCPECGAIIDDTEKHERWHDIVIGGLIRGGP